MATDGLRLLTTKDAPLETLDSGLRRRLHARSDGIDLAEYFYDRGMTSGEVTGHSHSFSTAVLIVSGRFELAIDGKKHVLGAGDSYVAMAGQTHLVTCVEPGSYVVAKPVSASGASSAAAGHGHTDEHEHGHRH
jgi:unsaturated pyranuronate lyase